MGLQRRMIIQKSNQMGWLKRTHSLLLIALAWSTWIFLIGCCFENSNAILNKEIVQHWTITDVAIGALVLCTVQLCMVHFWASYRRRPLNKGLF